MSERAKPVPSGTGRFFHITLGCKSNQYDTEAMASDLQKAGMSLSDLGAADVILVNTCMVTAPTEAQCRKEIRRARRANPGAKLVVTGCMSRGAVEQIQALPEVDVILDPGDRGRLGTILGVGDGQDWSDWPTEPAVGRAAGDRAFLKVQDGCDASCTYCIVPSVRGRSRSLDPVRVVDATRRLMASGSGEVVLSGIHLGQYGRGLRPAVTLEDLLQRLLEEELPGRIRLSSIEPLEITQRLVDILAISSGRICRHVHIPLQSGSDCVLARMGRPYTQDQFVAAVGRLRDAVPETGIGCDVICGFPGETETDFGATLDLVAGLRIPFIHAFPFSPRPGTAASRMADDVPHPVKKERVRRLMDMVRANRVAYAESFVGKRLQVAMESGPAARGHIRGLADTYLRVAVRYRPGITPGRLQEVLVTGTSGEGLVAVGQEGAPDG